MHFWRSGSRSIRVVRRRSRRLAGTAKSGLDGLYRYGGSRDFAAVKYATIGPRPTGVGIGTCPHGSLSRNTLREVLSCANVATAPAQGAVSRTLLRNVLTTTGDCEAIADSRSRPGPCGLLTGPDGRESFAWLASSQWARSSHLDHSPVGWARRPRSAQNYSRCSLPSTLGWVCKNRIQATAAING